MDPLKAPRRVGLAQLWSKSPSKPVPFSTRPMPTSMLGLNGPDVRTARATERHLTEIRAMREEARVEAERVATAAALQAKRDTRRFWLNTVLTAVSVAAAIVAAWAAVVVLGRGVG